MYDEFFIERRPEGDYAVLKPNADRASAVESTQADVIARARQMNPKATIHVERVRQTDAGSPDKWRNPLALRNFRAKGPLKVTTSMSCSPDFFCLRSWRP